MNFWTFLDRNIGLLVFASLGLAFFGALVVHESHGCGVKVGSTVVYVGPSVDGGAP
jgi:hypothetical protein